MSFIYFLDPAIPRDMTNLASVYCQTCLSTQAVRMIKRSQWAQLAKTYSTPDMRFLVPLDLFNKYLDGLLHRLMERSKNVIKCPNRDCLVPLEVDLTQTILSKAATEKAMQAADGLNGKQLNTLGTTHYLQYRFRCRNCNSDFCRLCRALPYHLGFDCKTHVEFKSAPKCRFCGDAVMSTNRIQKIPDNAIALHQVCGSDECAKKANNSCQKLLPCGHYCRGVRKDVECPPCLFEDCPGQRDDLCADDECAICYTDDLGEAPIVALTSCGHVFHFECLHSRLTKGWAGARINFQFLGCPLCKRLMESPVLAALQKPHLALRGMVRRAAYAKLKQEDLEAHERILDPSSRFFKKPKEFAMDHYMFYQCFQCRVPYFAGAAACGVGNEDEVVRQDLLCSKCQKVESMVSCKEHGDAFLIFKCRFCCAFSAFYCFGKTHFCQACHSGSVWPKLVDSGSGKNKKEIWAYSQCPGLEKGCLEVKNKRGVTEAQRLELYRKLVSNPADCPMGIRHPPSGFEFGVGCGQCKSKDPFEDEQAASGWNGLFGKKVFGPIVSVVSPNHRTAVGPLFTCEPVAIQKLSILVGSEMIVGLQITGLGFGKDNRLSEVVEERPARKGTAAVTTTEEIEFRQGEVIIALAGRADTRLHYLVFSTNMARTFRIGGGGGTYFKLSIPKNYAVVGFYGKTRDTILSLGVYVRSGLVL